MAESKEKKSKHVKPISFDIVFIASSLIIEFRLKFSNYGLSFQRNILPRPNHSDKTRFSSCSKDCLSQLLVIFYILGLGDRDAARVIMQKQINLNCF